MPRRRAPTIHGEVEYETKTCSTCGNEVAAEDAKPYFIGDVTKEYNWSHKDYTELNIEDNYTKGWLCPYCRDAEFISIDESNGIDTDRKVFFPLKILGGIRQAHATYVEDMVENLNGDFGARGPDVFIGLVMLSMYLLVAALVVGVGAGIILPFL